MHDPLTLVFRCGPLEIWHRDPCTDGSDDSCGWGWPRLDAKQIDGCKSLARTEAKHPWFKRSLGREIVDPVHARELARGLLWHVQGVAGCKLTTRQVEEISAQMTHSAVENWRGTFCFEPGWHSNQARDSVLDRERCAEQMFYSAVRMVLGERRRWWQHPRWHLWHWRVRITPIAVAWMKLTLRCSRCHGRFSRRDWKTTGAIRHFWDSSVHASCCSQGTVKA